MYQAKHKRHLCSILVTSHCMRMKLSLGVHASLSAVAALAASNALWPVVGVSASRAERSLQNNNKNNDKNNNNNNKDQQVENEVVVQNAGGRSWTTTRECNCWEYLTDDFWHYDPFWDGWKTHHHSHMAEFCCEFTAELVNPSCPDNGGFPNAPIEKMICDIFDQDLPKRATLKRQARDACYCYYRDLGCDNTLLEEGGYCNYPTNEIVLDDYRFANSSLVNMCNNCLEHDNNDKDYPKEYPLHYEGTSFNQCLGYCFLKKGDPNEVFKPTVENAQCCLDTNGQGFGLELHGYEDNEKANREISFFPALEDPHQKDYDFFFSKGTSVPNWSSPQLFDVMISYDGVDTATMEVQRFGTGSTVHMVDEFIVDCGAGKWDSINIHVYDESPDGGIAFTNVELDNVQLGDFGFAVKDDSCPVYTIKPDVAGIHGHNHTCVSRPGGYGHVAGFELTGKVELSGTFGGDDIGLALTVGCSQPKEVREVGCCGRTANEVPAAWSAW